MYELSTILIIFCYKTAMILKQISLDHSSNNFTSMI